MHLDMILSVEQAAKILGLGKRTVWRLIANNHISAVKMSVRRTGILESEINRYTATLPSYSQARREAHACRVESSPVVQDLMKGASA